MYESTGITKTLNIFPADEYNEEALKKHEQEMQRMNEFYEQNRGLFESVQEMHRLWNKFDEFEASFIHLIFVPKYQRFLHTKDIFCLFS